MSLIKKNRNFENQTKPFPNLGLNNLRLFKPKKIENKYFYPLANQSWDSEEHNAIINQLYSGKLTMGENVHLFEKEFCDYFGSKYAVMVNSGSSANLLIVAALTLLKKFNFNKGDEVIVPALGWSTSYSPFSQYGIKLRFVDINELTLNIDEDKIENAITKKSKAILAINILGNPVNFQKIKKICKKYDLILIEDNCESLGAKFSSKNTGTFGIAGSHSFFFSHHIQTIEGGMITTNDHDFYECCKSLRAHGWTRELSKKNAVKKSINEEFNDSFNFILPGYNLRPNEFNGVIGRCQLRKFSNFLKGRRKNAFLFKKLFENKSFCKLQDSHEGSSWYGFSILLDGNLKNRRDYVLQELKKNKIETRPVVSGNFLKNKVSEFYDYTISGDLTQVDNIDKNAFFVGNTHTDLSKQIFKLFELLDGLHKRIN